MINDEYTHRDDLSRTQKYYRRHKEKIKRQAKEWTRGHPQVVRERNNDMAFAYRRLRDIRAGVQA